jgi:hypothetical protein
MTVKMATSNMQPLHQLSRDNQRQLSSQFGIKSLGLQPSSYFVNPPMASKVMTQPVTPSNWGI